MASVAKAWLLQTQNRTASETQPHIMTFLTYGNEKDFITSKHPDIAFASFGRDSPIEPADRDHSAELLQDENSRVMVYLLDKFTDPYDHEVQVLDQLVNRTTPKLVVVDMFA